MLIVDSQVHVWGADTPQRPWPKRAEPQRPIPLDKDDLLREMDAAGVDRVVIVPPSWEGDRNDLAIEAHLAHPQRFATMGRLDPQDPASLVLCPLNNYTDFPVIPRGKRRRLTCKVISGTLH